MSEKIQFTIGKNIFCRAILSGNLTVSDEELNN